MPNHAAKAHLKMTCPKCGHQDSHPVTKTYRESGKWSDKSTRLFEKISGSDVRFRQREKACTRCRARFTSIEMSKHYLSDLIDHVGSLDSERSALQQQNHNLKKEAKRLREIIERVNALTS